jgi:hypothetical protein
MISRPGSNVTYFAGVLAALRVLLLRSVGRYPALPLGFRRFDPPHQIVGKARECLFKRLAAVVSRFAFRR